MYGNISTSFFIYTQYFLVLAEDGVVHDVSGVSTGLVVEDDESSLYPLIFLSETTPKQAKACGMFLHL